MATGGQSNEHSYFAQDALARVKIDQQVMSACLTLTACHGA
jgi:hypothetical protein